MTGRDDRYRALMLRLRERHERAAAMHDRERAAREQAEAAAAWWRNLAALGRFSGRNGIRGEQLLPGSTTRPVHIPAQRVAPAAEQRPTTRRTP